MGRTATRRRVKLAAVIAGFSAPAFLLLNRFTHHPDETVILLMSPALCSLLWLGWRDVRRIPAKKYVVYIAVLIPVIVAAEIYAAHMAMGSVLWVEVFWAMYFVVAWRAAWGVWARTVGRVGERHRRWGRIAAARAGGVMRIADPKRKRTAILARTIGPIRFCLVVFVFSPLMLGSLVHRIKIGNPRPTDEYAYMPIEEVSFETQDGVTLRGWFVPEENSDTTVLICHGLGANKGNFINFVTLFLGSGYSSLIFDFRGHGDSDGHTSTFGLFEAADVQTAVDFLKSRRPAHAKHVFGIASSMGAMALVRAARSDQRLEAVVLDSCFASAPGVARHHLGRLPVVGPLFSELVLASISLHVGASIWDLDARDAIAQLSPRPVLLIHGRDDIIIPPVNLSILYDAAREPKGRWLGPGPHSNVMTASFDEYRSRVLEFYGRTKEADSQE